MEINEDDDTTKNPEDYDEDYFESGEEEEETDDSYPRQRKKRFRNGGNYGGVNEVENDPSNNNNNEKDNISSSGDEASKSSRRKKKRPPHQRERPARTLFCLTLNNPLRKLCYAITEWKMFQNFLLLTILATCLSLALATPYPNDDSDPLNIKMERYEIVFTIIFTAECLMSIIASGLICHEGAYLRSGAWNILDFFVVVMGLLEPLITTIMPGFDVKALRAFRVLRPLKLVSGVPALQILMNAIMMAMIPLANIAILVLFIVVIYAIIGLEMFEGKLHRSCFSESTGEIMKEPTACGGGYNCEDREGWKCRPYWVGPNDGITNFDNIGLAILTVYQCVSLEGWSSMMYSLQDAMGEGWEWIYFCSMVLLGAFFVMNLVLGVLSGEFSKQKEKSESRIEALKMREEKLVEDKMGPYLDWITKGDLIGPGEQEESEYEKMMKNPKRRQMYFLIKSQSFYWTIILLVFWNTSVQATEHYRQPPWLEDFQERTNYCFVVLFVLEMLLKMYALGIPKYFAALFNRFDFLATVASVVETIVVALDIMPPIGVSVLRCTRLLRVFKVTRYWSGMNSLVSSLLGSVQSIVSLLFLLFLFMKIFALLGMQMFGGKFNFDKHAYPPRANFDSFSTSMLTIFQVLTGEDWNEVMWVGINSYGGIQGRGVVAVIYFVILFTLGNYILLNVFLAIAVDNLELEEEPEKEEEGEPEASAAEGVEGGQEEEPPSADSAAPIPEGSSFFILSQDNCFRKACYNFLTNSIVSNFLLICILVSSALMAAEDPVYEDSPRNQELEKIDYFFTAIFTFELVLKVLIYGLAFHPGAFLRVPANLLDLVVVGVSLFSIFGPKGGGASSLKILRVIRVLRPLRAVTRAKGLKLVIDCMIVAIKTIVNILIVTNLLQFMYANMGVQLFKGALYQCTDPSKKTEEECQGYFISYENEEENDGSKIRVLEPREWLNSPFNFDSVPNGMLTLFAVSTFEGWPQMLYKSIDAAGEGLAPIHNNRKIVAFFYISYLIIVSFFMINIFVGFVIMTFTNEKEKEFESCDLEKNHRDCIAFALTAKPVRKFIPHTPLQEKFWALVSSAPFDNISLTLIILNTFSLCAKFYEQPQWYTDIMDKVNIFFTIAFTLEFVIKFLAMGIGSYFTDAWNVFDAVIVGVSYVDIFFEDVNVGVLKLFRVGRLVKLLRKNAGMRTILWTFGKSLQALPYIILLILLVFFIYAIVGMQTFAKIKLDEETEIHRNCNFQNFGNTMLLLFRCATGEAWQDIMMGCVAQEHVKCFFPPTPEELEEGHQDMCGSDAAYPYFISFFVVCAFLVLNLFVAVIMDNFDYLTRDISILGAHHLVEFPQYWCNYDPDGTGKIWHDHLVGLLKQIDPPLGFGRMCPRKEAERRLLQMKVPLHADGTVGFNATLFALVRSGLSIRMEGGSPRVLDNELRSLILGLWKNIDRKLLDEVVPNPEGEPIHTLGKLYSALRIQKMFREYKKNKSMKVNADIIMMGKKFVRKRGSGRKEKEDFAPSSECTTATVTAQQSLEDPSTALDQAFIRRQEQQQELRGQAAEGAQLRTTLVDPVQPPPLKDTLIYNMSPEPPLPPHMLSPPFSELELPLGEEPLMTTTTTASDFPFFPNEAYEFEAIMAGGFAFEETTCPSALVRPPPPGHHPHQGPPPPGRRLLPQIPYWRYSCRSPMELMLRTRGVSYGYGRLLPSPIPPRPRSCGPGGGGMMVPPQVQAPPRYFQNRPRSLPLPQSMVHQAPNTRFEEELYRENCIDNLLMMDSKGPQTFTRRRILPMPPSQSPPLLLQLPEPDQVPEAHVHVRRPQPQLPQLPIAQPPLLRPPQPRQQQQKPHPPPPQGLPPPPPQHPKPLPPPLQPPPLQPPPQVHHNIPANLNNLNLYENELIMSGIGGMGMSSVSLDAPGSLDLLGGSQVLSPTPLTPPTPVSCSPPTVTSCSPPFLLNNPFPMVDDGPICLNSSNSNRGHVVLRADYVPPHNTNVGPIDHL